jgi:DNA replication protein DnaC
MTDATSLDALKKRARVLGLFGVLSKWSELAQQPWLQSLIDAEETERARRSLERRNRNAKLGRFKPLADFEWSYPVEIDRELIDQLLTLEFVTEPANVLIVGQNGAGKTMLAKNLAHHAIVHGYSALFVSASELLNDLAAQNTGSALTRRLRHYCRPHVLVIDELGYLASSSEHADLLFELIARRYQQKPVIITANKSFQEWSDVFPNAGCIVALVDRLVHKSEVVKISVDESYRLKEARQRSEERKKQRPSSRKHKSEVTA